MDLNVFHMNKVVAYGLRRSSELALLSSFLLLLLMLFLLLLVFQSVSLSMWLWLPLLLSL